MVNKANNFMGKFKFLGQTKQFIGSTRVSVAQHKLCEVCKGTKIILKKALISEKTRKI